MPQVPSAWHSKVPWLETRKCFLFQSSILTWKNRADRNLKFVPLGSRRAHDWLPSRLSNRTWAISTYSKLPKCSLCECSPLCSFNLSMIQYNGTWYVSIIFSVLWDSLINILIKFIPYFFLYLKASKDPSIYCYVDDAYYNIQ